MVHAVPDILKSIIATKHDELKQLTSLRAELELRASQRASRSFVGARSFRTALGNHHPAIIAEIKKASPSKGVLQSSFDPPTTARQYEEGGAAAISVLTDRDYFQGSLENMETARAAVSVPVLRKDFTVETLHVIEAAAHNADAILLIAAILSTSEIRGLRELAESYQMDVLVEVHDEDELKAALDSGAAIIGVNNRNLHTFDVDLNTSLRLAERIPGNIVKVAESGIHSRTDIQKLQSAGFQAFLVGEHLMKSGDPTAALKALQA